MFITKNKDSFQPKKKQKTSVCKHLAELMKKFRVRIQDLVKGGPQLLKPKVANVVEWSHMSEASCLQLGF